MSRSKGAAAEERALRWLEARGLKLVRRNFSCRRGEIDLIMLDRETLVFVEVRQRSRRSLTSAAESVDARKQQKLRLAAEYFLLQQPAWQNAPCRFDVVALDGPRDINWITNAF